uniref:C2H2-type domain-containing protein n=1 Tax=Salvator merianae TaxID=96440 RepID=A0A8D0DV04_SALMN
MFPRKWTEVFQGPGEELLGEGQPLLAAPARGPPGSSSLRRSAHCLGEPREQGSAMLAADAHTGPYICCECGEAFLDKALFTDHQESHGAGGAFPDVEPGGGPKLKPSPAVLPRAQTPARPKPAKRPEPPRSAALKPAAGRRPGNHMASSYICGECGRGFNHHSNFLRHQMIHTGERPYACGECGKTFIRKEHLATHRRLHTGERPYQCPLCQKSFTRKQHLVGHQRLHEGETPWLQQQPPQSPRGGKTLLQAESARLHRGPETRASNSDPPIERSVP